MSEATPQAAGTTQAGEKSNWEKPTLQEFQIAATTKNAGIINLDGDHALDIS